METKERITYTGNRSGVKAINYGFNSTLKPVRSEIDITNMNPEEYSQFYKDIVEKFKEHIVSLSREGKAIAGSLEIRIDPPIHR